ncbi:OFA family MFS transporter [Acidimangrovimonas sediminis]|uniref:OFA family MFS transporter n=1 Tax=Acidimangrovimonas sediminis TaxID=2056283 RepID=UPI000C7FF7C8|nr:OFA family MFS transporter [Acidimangrovimonas sediminis]
MASIADGAPASSILSREAIIAGPGYNRWLVVPAALCIHLCIGMAYGFSVFWLPMSHLVTQPAADCAGMGFFGMLTTTQCNWSVPAETHVFETFIAILGISAAIWGGWLEHAGPRKAGFIAALCWGGGMALGGLGVMWHQLWLFYLGTGVIGGVGQGLGYITPVSTLIKWFPDRRGMATGFAIMGYGGGAMIGAPLAVWLMKTFSGDGVQGVWQSMVILGIIYFIVMSIGAFSFRVAPTGWRPEGWTEADAAKSKAMITKRHVHLERVAKTPQFWLIWLVLCLNVTAGIGVISMASPMLQDVFGTHLLHGGGAGMTPEAQKAAIVAAAAGLVGLISLFNSLGRLFWASLSDRIGRKTTYYCFFILGMILYILLPTWGHMGIASMFVLSICIILTMYGGGFSTVPAYLADIFGTQMVGAIHGRLITAWSAAGIIGPVLIASVRQYQLDHGVPKTLVYDRTLYIMAGLLLLGLICNALVKPVHDKHFMDDEELAQERALQKDPGGAHASTAARGQFGALGVVFWLAVGIPFLIGVWIAIAKGAALF